MTPPEGGGELALIAGHRGVVRTAAFSPDGGRVVTASTDRTARIWDVGSGEEIFCWAGRRTPNERLDLLLQDAPDDLFVALMKKLPARADAVSKTAAALAAPLHANCYLAPTGLAELFPNRTRKRRIGRIAVVGGLVLVALTAILFFNRMGLLNMRKLMDLLNWTLR